MPSKTSVCVKRPLGLVCLLFSVVPLRDSVTCLLPFVFCFPTGPKEGLPSKGDGCWPSFNSHHQLAAATTLSTAPLFIHSPSLYPLLTNKTVTRL